MNPSDLIDKNRSELVAMLKEVMLDGPKSGFRKFGDALPFGKSAVWLKSPYGKRMVDFADSFDVAHGENGENGDNGDENGPERSDVRFLQLQGQDNHMAHMSRPR